MVQAKSQPLNGLIRPSEAAYKDALEVQDTEGSFDLSRVRLKTEMLQQASDSSIWTEFGEKRNACHFFLFYKRDMIWRLETTVGSGISCELLKDGRQVRVTCKSKSFWRRKRQLALETPAMIHLSGVAYQQHVLDEEAGPEIVDDRSSVKNGSQGTKEKVAANHQSAKQAGYDPVLEARSESVGSFVPPPGISASDDQSVRSKLTMSTLATRAMSDPDGDYASNEDCDVYVSMLNPSVNGLDDERRDDGETKFTLKTSESIVASSGPEVIMTSESYCLTQAPSFHGGGSPQADARDDRSSNISGVYSRKVKNSHISEDSNPPSMSSLVKGPFIEFGSEQSI